MICIISCRIKTVGADTPFGFLLPLTSIKSLGLTSEALVVSMSQELFSPSPPGDGGERNSASSGESPAPKGGMISPIEALTKCSAVGRKVYEA